MNPSCCVSVWVDVFYLACKTRKAFAIIAKEGTGQDILMTLGDRLRELRKQRGWTQKETAEKLGVHVRHYNRYENDQVEPPSKALKALAQLFEMTVEELLEANAREHFESLIPDAELFEQFQEVARLEKEDRDAVKRILSALIMNRKMQTMLVHQ
ncbi:MAG: helix-turn-helix transcriptional regulator [Candidatus Eremiobacteraeota bacterium]|nr:helix-turn-helix transcriptional regulator [Candidatus Eremiobacteraeota bacterium]